MTHKIPHITLIGGGNVAFHLADRLSNTRVIVDAVFSRTAAHAEETAALVNSAAITDAGMIPQGSDLYLVALADQATEDFVARFRPSHGIVAHTSGSLSLSMLAPTNRPHAVIYPLQTFSRSKRVDFSKIPVCTEASDDETLRFIDQIASLLTPDVRHIDTLQRQQTHLAAVFACNFSNFMYVAAADILKENGLPFDILLPLIREFFDKLNLMDPWEAQTGPAIRGDQNTIDRQLAMLSHMDGYRRLYELTSTLINDKKYAKHQHQA